MSDPVINFLLAYTLIIPISKKHASRVDILRETDGDVCNIDTNYYVVHSTSFLVKKCIQFLDLGDSESDKIHCNMIELSQLDKKYNVIFNNSNNLIYEN